MQGSDEIQDIMRDDGEFGTTLVRNASVARLSGIATGIGFVGFILAIAFMIAGGLNGLDIADLMLIGAGGAILLGMAGYSGMKCLGAVLTYVDTARLQSMSLTVALLKAISEED